MKKLRLKLTLKLLQQLLKNQELIIFNEKTNSVYDNKISNVSINSIVIQISLNGEII